jgi:hypothetical protein
MGAQLGVGAWAEQKIVREIMVLSFPEIPSGRIRALRENQGIIRRDACHAPSAWDVCRQPVQVAAPA